MEFFIEKFLLIYREMENAFGVEENIKRLMLRSKKKKCVFQSLTGSNPDRSILRSALFRYARASALLIGKRRLDFKVNSLKKE